MSQNKLTLEEIKARIKVVCICKGIKQGRICDAILSGCDTVEKVHRKTGSGTGGCKAVRCTPVIQKLIENKGQVVLEPHSTRIQEDPDDEE